MSGAPPSERPRTDSRSPWRSKGWIWQRWGRWQDADWRSEHASHSWGDSAEAWPEQEENDEGGEPWYLDAHSLVLNPSGASPHRFTLILLHSCTGGPDDWLPFFHRVNLPFRQQIRAVVPCSPVRHENHYGREKAMNSWFEYDGNSAKFPEQLAEQRSRILRIMEEERARLPDCDPARLVLGGLSQGAALAVDCALAAPYAVGGVVALRGMALPADSGSTGCQRELQVLASNGGRDWICPPEEARASYEALRPRGVRLSFFSEPSLAHGCARGRQRLSGRELQRIGEFLADVWRALP